MENPLFDLLRKKYQVGDAYISAYLFHMFKTDKLSVEQFNRKIADPLMKTWADYALSTNIRGREFAKMMQPNLPEHAKRYLDVGSAYGGFLIGFMEMGFEVKGIEIDEKLVLLSRANFKDHGNEDGSMLGDILDESLLPRLGKFDVITCIDVIEHVNDISKALKNMVGLLVPGGLLALSIPNKNSLAMVMADGHYNLCGITLLGRQDAKRYFDCHFKNAYPYRIGEYKSLKYYEKSLIKLGCRPILMPSLWQKELSEKRKLVQGCFRQLGELLFQDKDNLPFDLKIKIAWLAITNIVEFLLGLGIYNLMSKTQKQVFKNKFVEDTWFIIARN